jgi:serine protease Do
VKGKQRLQVCGLGQEFDAAIVMLHAPGGSVLPHVPGGGTQRRNHVDCRPAMRADQQGIWQKGEQMDIKIRHGRRWKLPLASFALLLGGGLAGSLLTAETGRSPIGMAKTVPVLVASNSPTPTVPVMAANGFSSVAEKDVAAIVNIASTKVVRSPGIDQNSPFFSDPFFRQFFGDQFGQHFQVPQEQREHSLGSGVIVNPDGYLLTNNHVIAGATDVEVTVGDKRQFKAHVIGTDPKTDIAVLKIDERDLPVLVFGDSSKVRVGDFALAIGNPFGLNQTVTMGIISATGRAGLGIEDYEDFIQTDASINPGNSGGALVNVNGELIGINTAILAGGTGGNQGIGFAIPINMARQVMDQILEQGKVVRGYLGAWIQPVTPQIAKAFGLSQMNGALLADVESGGPAAKSGLQRGDIVLEMNGKPISDTAEFRLQLSMMKPGTTVKLKVFRNGTVRDVDVVLGELPAQAAQAAGAASKPSAALQGLGVDNLNPQILRQLGLPPATRGVVITGVAQGSAAQDAGLRNGDVIQEVDRKPVRNVDEFTGAVSGLGKQPVLLLVNRGGNTLYVIVEPQ